MTIEHSVLKHIKKFGNTCVGTKTWKKSKETILALLHNNGIEVDVRYVPSKKNEWYGSMILEDFYVLEVKK